MQFVRLILVPVKSTGILLALITSVAGFSQINAPYSRYGVGDLYQSRNVTSKGMAGLAVAYADFQSINFTNPASYSKLQTVTFDVGIESEFRKMVNKAQTESYKSGNILFNYAVLGFPLLKNKKGLTKWGMALGIRPISRINYNITQNTRLPGIDSTQTNYEGKGGTYRAFIGTGFSLGNLSVGIHGGFIFGQQDINAYRTLQNDTVYYYQTQYTTKGYFSRLSADAGLQYEIKTSKKSRILLGATGFLGNTGKAERDVLRQTIYFNASGGTDSIDVIERGTQTGSITMPAGYSAAISLINLDKWLIGAEYEAVQWSKFRNFGVVEPLANSSLLRIGGQLTPDINSSKNYFKRITYRAGYFTGKDYIIAAGKQLPIWGVTIGAALPLRRWNMYSNQFTTINTALEIGNRGDNESPLKERFIRFSIGLSLSDIWFIKTKYD